MIAQFRPDGVADLSDFFRRYAAGTDPLPYADWLSVAGLALKVSGDRREVVEIPQASERQRRILASLLSGSAPMSVAPAAASARGR